MAIVTVLESLAERASRGEAVGEAEAREMLSAADLIAVGVVGDSVRRRLHGTRATFVRVFEVHVDAPPAALPPRLEAGELRVVGRPASIDQALAGARAAARLGGVTPVAGFSLADLQQLCVDGVSLRSLCEQLREAGLEAIAGVPVDAVEDAATAVREARAAGLTVSRLTVNALTADRRIELVMLARDLQAAVGGFRVFAPLPEIQSVTTPTTGYDDIKQIALARVVAANVESIQVDWVSYGPKLAQVALTTGADDIDRVSAVDPGLLGTRRSPIEEIRGNIRAAGLEPVERDGRFETSRA